MVDAKTGRVIDLIESREVEDVKNWLTRYPNIKMVSRDGSPTYAKAIAEAHPQAIQTSDRFHIIKNLCERSSEYLQKMFGGRISIPITDETKQQRRIMSDGTAEQRVEAIKALHKQGKSKEEIRLITGTAIKTINRYINATDFKSIRGRQHTEAVEKVQMKAELVKKLKEDGFSITSISKQTGFILFLNRSIDKK